MDCGSIFILVQFHEAKKLFFIHVDFMYERRMQMMFSSGINALIATETQPLNMRSSLCVER
jgi:hypothetical protein